MIKTLFVDDNPIALRMQEKQFSDICEFSSARDVPFALRLILENVFEFFVIDYTLPTGSGLELSRTIRAMDNHKKTPIILLSATMDDDIAYAAMRAGVNVSFDKMTPSSQIKATMLEMIEAPFIIEVVRERWQTKCIEWQKDGIFFQFCPELNITVSDTSAAGVSIKMEQRLVERVSTGCVTHIFSHDINIVNYNIPVPRIVEKL